jgi:hypothetical protein
MCLMYWFDCILVRVSIGLWGRIWYTEVAVSDSVLTIVSNVSIGLWGESGV